MIVPLHTLTHNSWDSTQKIKSKISQNLSMNGRGTHDVPALLKELLANNDSWGGRVSFLCLWQGTLAALPELSVFTGKGVHEVWKKWWWLDSRGTGGEEVVAGKEQNTVYAHIDIKYSILFKDLAIPRRLIGKKGIPEGEGWEGVKEYDHSTVYVSLLSKLIN